ncbi:MAG: class I SAM-dependent methyltransferase [Deltaproteobacteria bacterium]|nr:class I SAM-dependent methyltransferase [Deltaproteobacteria bacterium]
MPARGTAAARGAEPSRLYRRFVSECARAAREQGAALWCEQSAAERAFVRGHYRPGRALVAGCGTGRFVQELLDWGAQVTAIDRDESMCSLVRERFGARVDVHCVELRELADALDGARFDTMLCLGLVSGALFLPGEEPVACLAAMRRSLAGRGVLLLDFLQASGQGQLARFAYPLGEARIPGCCFWPSRSQVLSCLQRAGLRARMHRLRYDPAEPLWGASCLAAG